ncbi:hypothetical protein Y032_0024g1079 [Ancylostoma ceylanicum]|uniref:Zinc finger PHD-type domain-containing protein n=1 Tax=Ancylostoma ceylanicum TaxID=53326 RepID=A0A016UY81_9BILA|nr:hypothetical protein Y032_0024g1079 [Ancylostoma ceylanicum]
MPLAEPTDLVILSPKKTVFSDISNMVVSPSSAEAPTKPQGLDNEKKWSCRHDPQVFCFTHEQAMQQENDKLKQLRDKIEKPVVQEVCNRVHHSTYSLDDLVESIENYLDDFYVKGEHVEFSTSKDRTVRAKILGVEKKGGAVFYTLGYDNKEIGKISKRDLRRRYEVTEDDIRSLILLMASQHHGKPWQVDEAYKKEYCVKDKLAPIFCSSSQTKASNKIVNTTGRTPQIENGKEDDSDSDTPLSQFVGQRRSGVALPPNASSKDVEKQRKKQEKKERREKEKKEKSEKKEGKEKSEKKQTGEKKEAKENGGLNKFICSTPSNGDKSSTSADSPFLTPQKRSEKRFNSAVNKLQEAWRKRDEQEFYTAASWGAKVLSGVQIDKIPHECHRFAVRKAYDKVKDAEMLKKLRTKEARKEFRDKIHQERHHHQKVMTAKIKAYFNQKAADDDLSVCDKPLPCPGRIVPVPDGQSLLFTDCLILTQFFSSLKKFIEADHKITAKQLLDAIHGGRVGFMKCTSKLLGSLLKTLLQDPEHKKLSHFNVRLHEFPIEGNTVSELCRALLIGNMGVEEESAHGAGDNAETSSQNGVHENDGDDDNVPESGRGTPFGQNDVSQIDIDVCQTFLDRFSPEKEIWELTPEEQLGVLGLVLNRVLDLGSFKDYISQDGVSGPVQSLQEKIHKLNEQVSAWQEELSKIPEVEEVADLTQISRSEARERAETQKKRENLERKIEENKDKVEELLEKLAIEKLMKSQSKRVSPLGQDRHFRNYYWFHGNTGDDGIWVQDMGVTSYEKFIRACIKAGKPFDEEIESPVQNGATGAEDQKPADAAPAVEGKTDDGWPVLEPESYKETWYRLPDVQSFDDLINSLNKVGVRESKLKSALVKQREVIVNSITRGNARDSKSPDPVDGEAEDEDLCPESLTPLRRSIVQLVSDLRDSYLTSIASVDAFEAELMCCSGLDEVKEKLRDVADSINPSAIVKRLNMKIAIQTGHFSHLILDRWKHRLTECHNASAVHLLRSYLDSRIDWKKSVVEKRCNSCGSRRTPEAKIACGSCELVVHYYCTRPKLSEKPTFWLCPTCKLAEAKKKKEEAVNQRTSTKPNYKEDDEESGDESGEDESDASASDDDDDFFSKKPRRTVKRKGFSIFDDEVTEDKTSRAKRAKVNKVAEDCLDLLNRVKSSNRLYRALQAIPPGRATRRATPSSIDGLEEGISQYASLSSFAADLDSFFKYAHSYLEEHNERKLEDLENLLSELDLDSIIKLR